jgi:hypothetical protein
VRPGHGEPPCPGRRGRPCDERTLGSLRASGVDGRYSTIALTTKLAELPAGYLTDDQSVKLLLDRVTILQKEIYELIREMEGSDSSTSNKLQDLG